MDGARVTRIAVALAVLLLAWVGPAAAEPPFRRGIAIHSLMNWGTLEAGRPGRYTKTPFAGPDYAVPDALLSAVAQAGFDFVRLTVDPGPFLQLTGPPRDGLDATLVATVRRLQGFGFGVVVDLHGNTQVPAYDPVAITASEDSALFRNYAELVRRTARLLARLDRPNLAFELMNEPPYGYDPESRARWQRMTRTLHDAARAEAPNLTLILSGSHGGDREGLQALDPAPFRSSRVLYSFHYYEPHDFTHQGVPDEGLAGRYRGHLSDMPYPSDSVPRAVVEATVRANIAADPDLSLVSRLAVQRQAQTAISAYLQSHRDRAAIARDLEAVSSWARRNGIADDRILLGEFGATRTYDDHRAADPVSYENWIRYVRSEAEARGFGWAIWVLTGTGGMALVATDGGTELDATSLRALGLNVPATMR